MWTYIKLILGVLLIIGSIGGGSALFTGDLTEAGRRIVEGGVDTTGVIKKRTEHTVVGRLGRAVGGGRYYSIEYQFTTKDGKTYSKEINVSKKDAYAAHEGQQIRVRYYDKQPSINSALDYKEYMTMEDAEDVPVGTIVFSALLMFGGGVYLTWSSWNKIRPAPAPQPAVQRVGAVSRGPRRAGFGQR